MFSGKKDREKGRKEMFSRINTRGAGRAAQEATRCHRRLVLRAYTAAEGWNWRLRAVLARRGYTHKDGMGKS